MMTKASLLFSEIIRRLVMFKIKDLFKTKNLALMALLVAANVVFSRFLSINTFNIKIGFTFLTVMMAAYLFGPVGAMLVGGLGDVIGALLFPIAPFFPGFTLTAVITGLLYSFFINKKTSLVKIIIGVTVTELFCSGLMNTFWIAYMYGSDFGALFVTRLTTQIIAMTVVEIVAAQLIFGKKMAIERITNSLK